MPISVADILTARRRIAPHVRRTSLEPSPSLTERCDAPVWLKREHHQVTGSFKVRGATNAVLALRDAERARGIVGVSTGNHGRGLAHAARAAGARCVICMSSLVPENKVEAIRALGAEVHIVGDSQDEAQQEVDRLVADEGLTMLPPFDHPDIIAGQGTVGLEMAEDRPDVETVLVPLSGGGLIAGIALAVKAANPRVRVIGISMAKGAAMVESLRAGHPMAVREEASLADSLGGGIGMDNAHTFAMVRDLVDDTLTLSEDEIAAGIRHAYAQEREIVEGAGAVGLAALLAGRVTIDGPTIVLLSGRNIDMGLHRRIIAGWSDAERLEP